MKVEDRLERMLPVWLQHTRAEGNEGVGDPASWVQHTLVALGVALVLAPFIGWLEGRRIAFGLYAGRELVQFLVHFFHGGEGAAFQWHVTIYDRLKAGWAGDGLGDMGGPTALLVAPWLVIPWLAWVGAVIYRLRRLREVNATLSRNTR